MVMPSALAVFRLITSSNRIAWMADEIAYAVTPYRRR
jgi:hypothetical protein